MLTIDQIRESVLSLTTRYDVNRVDLFGSYATNQATVQSDVDFLVEFATPIPSIFAVMGLKAELSSTLKKEVDVVTVPLVNPDLLHTREVINIYART